MSITIPPNERLELAVATGTELRVQHRVLAGTARIVASALEYDRDDAWDQSRRRVRRRVALQRVGDLLTDAVDEGILTLQESLVLRAEVEDGVLRNLPEVIRDRANGVLKEQVVDVELTSSANRTSVQASGRNSRRRKTVMHVEAVAGPDGATIEVGEVEAR